MSTEGEHAHLIQGWYDEYGLNHHHLQSFNQFVCKGIRAIIQSTPIHFVTSKGVSVEILLDNVFVPLPYIYDESRRRVLVTPYDCRQKNLTYSSPIYVSVIEIKDGVRTHHDRMVLANLPIMLGSNYCVLTKYRYRNKECFHDPGGYFIVNGIERVLVTQQRNNYNSVLVLEDKNESYRAEMRSMSDDTNHSVLVQAWINRKGTTITFTLPYLKQPINFLTLMLALDVQPDQVFHLLQFFPLAHRLYGLEHALQFMGREMEQLGLHTPVDARRYIGSCGTKIDGHTDLEAYAQQILDIELFPHLGVFSDAQYKVDLLLYFAYRLWLVQQKILHVHDKDNLSNKRFETSGILIAELFKSLYRAAVSDIENEYEKNSSLVDMFGRIDGTITKNLKYCFSTGKWGVQRNAYIRQGVSQVLNRLSYIAMCSHLQRVVIPIGKEGKNFKIRQIHPSSFGYICMYETPEGQSCGIVLNFTLSTRVSEGYAFPHVTSILRSRTPLQSRPQTRTVPVFLNGLLVGFTTEPSAYAALVRHLRRQRVLPHDLSVAWDTIECEIRMYCDKGRLIRPFLRERIDPSITFAQAVTEGWIEWLDPNEVQSLVIAMYPHEPGDYCEIHPSLLLGACTGAIPFLDHNQSPRNVYESSMMKQAVGMFATNYSYRYDAAFHVLNYPQKSLVSTHTARLVGMHDMPAGVNCIVAISTFGGWNAEDSIILNKSAIERGLFCSDVYHTYTFEDKTFKSESCKRICIPPAHLRKPEWNYYHLDERGLVRKNAIVRRTDVILGQVYHSVEHRDGDRFETQTDCSELAEEEGVIDRVESIDTPSGNRLIKIIIRQLRIPEIGDKFANMAAQKGTCALIVPQEDMPFTRDGIAPDIMMNSHALPSRMTISMLLEMVVGKTCLLRGELGDATPFSQSSINIAQRLEDTLVQYGYERHGWEIMHNGHTGEPLRSKIFIGSSYYQKLKHMVADKIHARSYGNVTSLTRQPLAGRSKDGGLRLGEMERDCLLSHGSVQFLRERLFDMSDAFSVLVCNECGMMSNNKDECHQCKNNALVRTNTPYASKLLFQMLNGCLIQTKFHSVTQ
jgi:DNA-directed RNA polymerase II subunit RPB2